MRESFFPCLRFGLTLTCLLLASPAFAQPKKDAKTLPRVIVALPLTAKVGATIKISLRGSNLDKVTEASVSVDAIKIKLLDKNKSTIGDAKYAERLGDTQATLELTIPQDTLQTAVLIELKSADGVAEPHQLLIDRETPIFEKEPNEGFRQAQAIKLPLLLDGSIKGNQDVDVFSFAGTKGKPVRFEVVAARRGSPVDPLLTLYDAAGNQVAAGVKCKDSADCVLEAILPGEGVYYLALIDAHDLGSSVHVYRLIGHCER